MREVRFRVNEMWVQETISAIKRPLFAIPNPLLVKIGYESTCHTERRKTESQERTARYKLTVAHN